METILIDGKNVAKQLRREIKAEVTAMQKQPTAVVFVVGDDPASHVYAASQQKSFAAAGFRLDIVKLPSDISQDLFIALLKGACEEPGIDGVFTHLPLPRHMKETDVLRAIDARKDIDGASPLSAGLLAIGQPHLTPATPTACMELLHRYNIEISGKNCVVVGRSNIVGRPVAQMLLNQNGTVTICHSRTQDLATVCRTADILIVAVGKPKLITGDMIKEGAVVLDVGIHEDGDTLCGDVDFDSCMGKASYLTPVPGGVGPVTVCMLMKNVLKAKM